MPAKDFLVSNSLTDCNKRAIFTLTKMSYLTCDAKEKYWYNKRLNGYSNIDIQICCIKLFEIIQKNSNNANNNYYYNFKHKKYNTYKNSLNICMYAALYGHLDCLKFAHEHGCPWEENTCSLAAQQGYLEILIYAHKNGCPWSYGEMLRCYRIISRKGGKLVRCKKYIESLMN